MNVNFGKQILKYLLHIFKFMNLILGLDDEEESSIPEKKKRKTRDISPIEWDRKSEGKSEEEEGEEEDAKSDDNKSEKSEDSTARSE